MHKSAIYNYNDLVPFLQDYFLFIRNNRKSFSYAAWSKTLGFQDDSTLIKILRRQRNLGPKVVVKIENYFEFDHEEKEYFRLLVLLSRSDLTPETQEKLCRSLKPE